MPTLREMWLAGQFVGKQSKQIIPLAGDSNIHSEHTSLEIRDWLTQVAVEDLQRFARECLEDGKSQYSGYFLQDIMNELGRRLGFDVTFGRYQGSASNPAPDGVWRSEDWSFVVEVKTTDAFRVALDRIAHYRTVTFGADDTRSSVLIVVGRSDTGDLEAQIRGSKHAWDMRLIGIDALFKLVLFHRDSVEQENVLAKIRAILRPVEYTRVDNLLDVVFETAQAASGENGSEPVEAAQVPHAATADNDVPQPIVAAARREQFRLNVIRTVSSRFDQPLTKIRRSLYVSPDGSLRASLAISKNYGTLDEASFWYAFHTSQLVFLQGATHGVALFGCEELNAVVMLPVDVLARELSNLNATTGQDRPPYWHVVIETRRGSYWIQPKSGAKPVDVTNFVVRLPD